ncbi:MAG: site-specific DNA-methyltransferase [Coriobacteriia bacterium]
MKDMGGQVTTVLDQEGAVLLQGDALEALRNIPSDTVDCIYADPPYFLSNGGISCSNGKMVSVNKGDWDRSEGPEANFEWNKTWLSECRRVLKKDGTIWVSGTLHNIYGVGYAMQLLGYRILNDIAWIKPNAAPNLSCRYFTHSHETVIWAAKSEKSRHKFSYAEMKLENGGKQMRSFWTFTTPRKCEKKHGKHPTQKPEALIDRIIRASTDVGDLVLDPFVGSGTTCVVATRLGRRCIGIDNSPEFLEIAQKRLQDELRTPVLSAT